MKPILRKDLEKQVKEALDLTESALEQSHCPHSGLCVSAGLMLASGGLVSGVNYESDSYGLTLCAERAALVRAQTEGTIEQASGIVISARWRDHSPCAEPLTPCGACRQWLAELSRRLGRDLPVYSFWASAERGSLSSAMELLPGAFSIKEHTND